MAEGDGKPMNPMPKSERREVLADYRLLFAHPCYRWAGLVWLARVIATFAYIWMTRPDS